MKKSRASVRAKADKIRDFRCKNLIAVMENPDDIRNIGTIIRNVNALGVEKAYIVTSHESLPDDWQEMRGRSKLNAVSASGIKWSFVKKFEDTFYERKLLSALGEEWLRVCRNLTTYEGS